MECAENAHASKWQKKKKKMTSEKRRNIKKETKDDRKGETWK